MAKGANARHFGQTHAGGAPARSTGGQQQQGRTSLTHSTKGIPARVPEHLGALAKGKKSTTLNTQPVSGKQRT